MVDPKSEEFSEYYKTISNAELLNILENYENYQPSAVEAAKTEYATRNLSDTEAEEARNALNQEKEKKDVKKEKLRAIENKAKSIAIEISETIRPSQYSTLSTNKIINIISLVFGAILIFRLIFDVRSIFDYFEKFSLHIVWYVEPLLVLSLAVFFFWQRVTVGWILLMFFVIYSLAGECWMFYKYFQLSSNDKYGIDRLFPRPSLEGVVLQLVFLIGTILILCKQNIREAYKITRSKMLNTIIISGILTILMMIFIY